RRGSSDDRISLHDRLPAQQHAHALQQRPDAALALVGNWRGIGERERQLLVLGADAEFGLRLGASGEPRDQFVARLDRRHVELVTSHEDSGKWAPRKGPERAARKGRGPYGAVRARATWQRSARRAAVWRIGRSGQAQGRPRAGRCQGRGFLRRQGRRSTARRAVVAGIVGALGVPHTPYYPSLVEREGPGCDTARFFAALTAELEAMRPDLIVIYDTDHLNTFFLDNLPIFAVGVTESFKGPND